MIEAESFSRGNVLADHDEHGREIGVIVAGSQSPLFVEYDISVAVAGVYRLETRYAAAEPFPVLVTMNDRIIDRRACAQTTDSWSPAGQAWTTVGTCVLHEGKNKLRLTAPWRMPHFDKWVLVRVADSVGEAASTALAAYENVRGTWSSTSVPTPFAAKTFDDFQLNPNGELTQAKAGQWLEPLPGQSFQCADTANAYGRGVVFTGKARLRPTWFPDSALRLGLMATTPMQIAFWNGHEGIVLRHYPQHGQSWSAYRITRQPGTSLVAGGQQLTFADPDLALLATDNGRNARAIGGTFQFRHQDQSLVVTKGDVRLLTAPLDAPPTDVYLESAGVLVREIDFWRSEPAPDEPIRAGELVMTGQQPALLDWKENLPAGARVDRLPDGRIGLATQQTTAPSWIAVPLLRPGLYETIFHVDEASPGTGLYFGDDAGRPLQGVQFFPNPATGGAALACVNLGVASPVTFDHLTAPSSAAGPGQWVRLVAGLGVVKCWISGDGVHWSQPLAAAPRAWGSYSHLVVYSQAGSERHAIKLRRLQVRRLAAISALASLELQEQAAKSYLLPADDPTFDLGAWQQRVWETQPADVELDDWRRACAITTLAAGPKPPLATAIAELLVEEVLASDAPIADKFALCEDVGLLRDALPGEDVARLVARYDRLGQSLARGGEPDSFAIVRRALHTYPGTLPAAPLPLYEDLARGALIEGVNRHRWESVRTFADQLRFWNQPAALVAAWPAGQTNLKSVTDWASLQANRALPPQEKAPTFAPAVTANDWRHPLIVEIGKEAFNTMAEVQVALRDQSFQDACQIIVNSVQVKDLGLMPDGADPLLSVSFAAVIKGAMRNHAGLRKLMLERYAPLGLLEMRRAINDGNKSVIESAALQYYGTPTAAEANAWLGDRNLVTGQFSAALANYKQALRYTTAAQKHELSARVRLTGALVGRELGEPLSRPVRLGDEELSVERFEQLIGELLKQSGGTPGKAAAQAGQGSGPARFDVRPWASFEGDMGSQPNMAQAVDWTARQLSVLTSGGRMIVANRYQVSAFDLASGAAQWNFGLGGRQGAAHIWPMIAMRPVIVGDRVFARMMTNSGRPELYCIELATGKSLWNNQYPGLLVSDPHWLRDRLIALAVEPDGDPRTMPLLYVAFHPDTGAVVEKKKLVRLHQNWSVQNVCQTIVADEHLVAAVAGSVLSCDGNGQIEWARQSAWIPPALDGYWQQQFHQPPLVADTRVIVAQPGSPTIECVDLESGNLEWQALAPGTTRTLGLAANRVLVEGRDGIRALDVQTGELAWHSPQGNLLAGSMTSGNDLVVIERETLSSNIAGPAVVWIDAETGAVRGRSVLGPLAGKQPLVGPLAAHDGRLWCFAAAVDGNGNPQPQRRIFELVANGPSEDAKLVGPWTTSVTLDRAARTVLPGWRVLAGDEDDKTGLRTQVGDRANVLVTKATERAVRLATRVSVPSEGKPRLSLEIGHDPNLRSKIEVRIAGVTAAQVTTTAAPSANQWTPIDIDLSSYAGQTVAITLVQEHTGTVPTYAYWSRAQVIP